MSIVKKANRESGIEFTQPDKIANPAEHSIIQPIPFSDLEDILKDPAAFQKILTSSSLNAIQKAKQKGLPITYLLNGKIIKESHDGKKVVIGTINKPKRKNEPKKGEKRLIFK